MTWLLLTKGVLFCRRNVPLNSEMAYTLVAPDSCRAIMGRQHNERSEPISYWLGHALDRCKVILMRLEAWALNLTTELTAWV